MSKIDFEKLASLFQEENQRLRQRLEQCDEHCKKTDAESSRWLFECKRLQTQLEQAKDEHEDPAMWIIDSRSNLTDEFLAKWGIRTEARIAWTPDEMASEHKPMTEAIRLLIKEVRSQRTAIQYLKNLLLAAQRSQRNACTERNDLLVDFQFIKDRATKALEPKHGPDQKAD